MSMMERTGVAIIGAGVTGLALGFELHRAGIPFRILEASDRPGGVVRSARIDGHLLEWGPQRTRLTPAIGELIEALQLRDEVITAPTDLPLLVYSAGKLRTVPFSPSALLRSDIVPLRGKVRALLEPFTAPARAEESVAAYFSRKLGRHLYENMAGPLYGGLYASDPKDMVVGLSLGRVLAEFGVGRSLLWALLRRGGRVDPPPPLSFAEGMESLPRALFERIADRVDLGCPVQAMERVGERWIIESEGGRVEAEQVVLTTPAPVATRLLARSAPTASTRIAELHYNPLAVVHLHAETSLHGLGFQVSLGERHLVTRGVTFNDSLFRRAGVYTCYLGGARAPHVIEWSDAKLGEAAIGEFRQITGFDARVVSVEREAMPAWDLTWAALEGLSLPPGVQIAANWESRPGLPGRLAQAKRLAAEFTREMGVVRR